MFSPRIQYNVLYLEDVRSVAVTSFFSLKSVSHLDLQLTKRGLSKKGVDRRIFELGKTFFCTEESFRNAVAPQRRILYSLNLDFHQAREHSNLRSGPAHFDYRDTFGDIFVAVAGYDNFFRNELVGLIQLACEETGCKLKLLKWMADFRPLESVFVFLPLRVQLSSALTLYRDCEDSVFAMKFFSRFLRLAVLCRIQDLNIFEYLLYTARTVDFEIRGEMTKNLNLIDYFMSHFGFRVIQSVLKSVYTSLYTDEAYEYLKKSISGVWPGTVLEELNRLENRTSKPRLQRMMQIIHIFRCDYLHQYLSYYFLRPEASEALRLVWASTSDPYVSLAEMTEAYDHVIPPDVVRKAHGFYEAVIGQQVLDREPRSLAQYCRTAIRRKLYDSKRWLPDGVEQLKLPPRVKSFLNLQRDDLLPDNFRAPYQARLTNIESKVSRTSPGTFHIVRKHDFGDF